MQISSGWAKGLKLAIPSGESTRPTSGKVRAAVLNMLLPHLDGAFFLDLFAGSGAMGIEAVSRGGRGAVFVEKDSATVACLRKNVAELERRAARQGIEHDTLAVVARDAQSAVARLDTFGAFDVIYVDPPYAQAVTLLETLGPRLAELATAEGILIVETAATDGARIAQAASSVTAFGWELVKQKEYGDTMVTMWSRAESQS